MLIEDGDDSSNSWRTNDEEPIEHGKERADDDKPWLKSIGINVGEMKKASSGRTE
jgi:hypothetical protein